MLCHLALWLRQAVACLPALLLGFVSLACSDSDPTSRPDPTTEDWSFGDSQVHEVPSVAGARIEDASTGETFSFPEGGGELTVTPIVSGPEIGADDNAFEILYTGTGAVEIVVLPAADEFDVILRHMPFGDVIQEGSVFEDAGWVPLASLTEAPDTVRVELLPADEALVKMTVGINQTKGAAATATKISKFRRISVKTSSPYGVKLAAFKTNVKDAVDDLVLAVADHRRPDVRRAIDGHLAYVVHLRERAKVGPNASPCYAPYYNDNLRLFVWCGLMMIDDCAGSVAHETGHYFHHVLLGTATFMTFQGLRPVMKSDGRGPRTTSSRSRPISPSTTSRV
jgi:hypothetical protein